MGAVQTVGVSGESASTPRFLWGPGAESWRQHLVSLTLVLLDVLLALAVWQVAILLRAFFGGSPVSEATLAGALPIVAAGWGYALCSACTPATG